MAEKKGTVQVKPDENVRTWATKEGAEALKAPRIPCFEQLFGEEIEKRREERERQAARGSQAAPNPSGTKSDK